MTSGADPRALRPLVVWGASGHAKVLAEFVSRIGYRLEALFDNDPAARPPLPDVPLFIGEAGFADWRQEHRAEHACLVAIGGQHGRDRVAIQRRLAREGLLPAVAVHPAAYVSPSVRLSPGLQVLAHATVAAEVRVGESVVINTAASVDHESELGDGVHIGPGAVLAGCVVVGEGSFVGTGAVVLPRVRIGEDCIVGAGAVVTRDLPGGSVAYGNPARVRGARAPSEGRR
ncbi:MAG: acetyltransferase [Betaproteobacteria bacterium]|nr:acetyltransferase [Betaproteobacteria bacterium]